MLKNGPGEKTGRMKGLTEEAKVDERKRAEHALATEKDGNPKAKRGEDLGAGHETLARGMGS